jgi:hypothetical protein
MKKYIYRVRDMKHISYSMMYRHWSEEKYVLADNRKDAIKLIFDKENTKQIKLITCLKFTNVYDMISTMLENVEVDNSSPILWVFDKWGKQYIRNANDIKKLIFSYINRFKGTVYIHYLKGDTRYNYMYEKVFKEEL